MTKINLNDMEEIASLDSSDMLGAVGRFPDPIAERTTKISWKARSADVRNVVLMGMGGSASAGDFVLDWLRPELKIPGMVQREPTIPGFVDFRTLFVAISYSGETFETLAAFKDAARRGAVIAGIGTGGTLATTCAQLKAPFISVQRTVAPRAALSQLIVAVSDVLESLSLTRSTLRERSDTFRELTGLRKQVEAATPIDRNPAKRLALALFGRFLAVYSLQRMVSVAQRFKNQLAENSKEQSRFGLLPEACHNEIEGWQSSSRLTPVLIRGTESPLEHSIIEAFRSTIRISAKVRPIDVRIIGRNHLSRLLVPTMYLDFVSTYLALLNGVDPTPTPLIAKYREKL